MGYETKMFVVDEHTFPSSPYRYGHVIAMIDLCKCGVEGKLPALIARGIKQQRKAPRQFVLWPLNPDRQQEAADYLKDKAGEVDLACAIEDGRITRDQYDDPLGVLDIDEVIDALKCDLAVEKYRRYSIALATLEAVKQGNFGNLLVVTYGY